MSINYTEGTPISLQAYGVAFDSADGSFYTIDGASGMDVVNESTWKTTGSMSVTSGEYAKIAIDPDHALGFVNAGFTAGLYVFNTTTLTMVKSIPTNEGQGVALDPLHHLVVYTNGTDVTFYNYATWAVLWNCPMTSPYRIAIDTHHQIVAVTYDSNRVAFLNETTRHWVSNATAVWSGVSVQYDPVSNNFIVADDNAYNFSLVRFGNPPTVQNFTVPVGQNLGSLAVVNGPADEVLFWMYAGSGGTRLLPFDIATSTFLNSVVPPTGGWPSDIAIDPKTLVALGDDQLYSNLIPFYPVFPVTFSETGLPGGTNWCVTILTVPTCSTSGTIYYNETPGTYGFSIGNVASYTANPSSGSIVVSEGPVNQLIRFSVTPMYSLTFTESGLPAGTSWHVTLNGSTQASSTSTITFSEENGSYSYTLDSPIAIGSWKQYATFPTSGSVVVNGGPVNKPVTYVEQFLLTFVSSPASGGTTSPASGWYNASSTQKLDATPASGYTFAAWVGSGPGAYSGPTNPKNLVMTGSDNETATFPKIVAYTVMFNEMGLPAGTLWSVNLSGVVRNSTTPSVTFSELNGTYSYNVSNPISIGAWKEYSTTAASGQVTVDGNSVSKTVSFMEYFKLTVAASPNTGGTVSPTSGWFGAGGAANLDATPASGYHFINWTGTGPGAYSGTTNPENLILSGSDNETANFVRVVLSYTAYFNETGLPVGLQWSVNLSGTVEQSTTSSVSFTEINGTYDYEIESPITIGAWKEYVTTPSSGSVTVNGSSLSTAVPYTEKFLVTMHANPSNGGITRPASGWYAASSVVELNAIATSPFVFGTWVGTGPGAYSGTNDPENFSLGGSVNETATFTRTNTYTVTFNQTGLPVGIQWYVNLSGTQRFSTTSTAVFMTLNGSYSYTIQTPINVGNWRRYEATPFSGSVKVNGSNVVQVVTFSEELWLNVSSSPSSDGTTSPSTGWHDAGSIVMLVATPANGYAFTNWVGTGPGAYSGTDNPKSLTLGGSDNETANFILPTYTVTFLETNLNSGTAWSVTLAGKTSWSSDTTVTFALSNGTYNYTVNVPSGYTATPNSGFVDIAGRASTVGVTFQAVSPTPNQNFFTYSAMGIPLYWFIIVIAVILVVLVILLYRRRRKPVKSTESTAPVASVANLGPSPAPVRPPSIPKAEWSEEGIDARGATAHDLPAKTNVPQHDPSKPWAVNLTSEGVEVLGVSQEGQPSGPILPDQPGRPGTAPQPPARRIAPSPVDVYNVLKTLEKGPRSAAELEWRVEIFGNDRMADLLAILTNAELIKAQKSDASVDQYVLTPRGQFVVRQKASKDSGVTQAPVSVESYPVQSTTPKPQSLPKSNDGTLPPNESPLGEERKTTAETSPFGPDLRPEDVNPQLKGREPLRKQDLQPLEIRVQAERGADARETTIQPDSEAQAQALMEKANRARRRPKSKFGVEQEAKPSDADSENRKKG
jgi:hypothetical protein